MEEKGGEEGEGRGKDGSRRGGGGILSLRTASLSLLGCASFGVAFATEL